MHETESLRDLAVAALEELKALDVTVLDVRGKVSWTDFMVVASGNSDRHVRALARNVGTRASEAGHPPLGVEGDQEGEWVLIDLADVVVINRKGIRQDLPQGLAHHIRPPIALSLAQEIDNRRLISSPERGADSSPSIAL